MFILVLSMWLVSVGAQFVAIRSKLNLYIGCNLMVADDVSLLKLVGKHGDMAAVGANSLCPNQSANAAQ